MVRAGRGQEREQNRTVCSTRAHPERSQFVAEYKNSSSGILPASLVRAWHRNCNFEAVGRLPLNWTARASAAESGLSVLCYRPEGSIVSVDQLSEDVESAAATANEMQVAQPEQQTKVRRKTKSRVLLNFWVDAALLACVVFIGWVSAITYIAFPAPTKADGWTLWGLTFDRWHDLQSTAMCMCAIIALEHLVLHWNWVCSTIATRILRTRNRPDEGLQSVYGVGTFIVVMLIIFAGMASAVLSVKRPSL
jgi:hypothetical protein